MLNFLGMTRHLSTTAGYAKRIGWLLFEDVTQSPFPLTGVSFTGVVKTEQGDLPVVIEHGEQEHCLELTFPALPVGRWPYAIHAQDESGEDLRLFSGYIGAVDSVAPVESSTVYDIPAMGITIPVEASKTIKAQWLSNTASIIAAQQAQQNANTSSTNAETASQAAKTATDAAATAAARAEEAEGYAGSAWASKSAAADSATAAGTSATNAARDAKSANDAKTDVESLADAWPETVNNGKQQIIEARNEAVTAIQDKQADSVLAVGRASQTAQQNIAGARTDAVAAVQTAQERAVGAITPLVQRAETAKEDIDQAERRINTAATNAANSATSAGNSATAAANALAAMPQVDASGNMTLAGNITAAGGTFAGAVNANGGINSPSPIATMQSMTTLGAGYAAEAFDLSGYVDLRNIAFANAVNVSKVTYPYLMDKDLVIFREVSAGNNFMSYPLIKFDRYNFAWGTFPPSSMVLSMGGTYMNFEAGEHNAFMGFALGQTSIDAQSVSEVAPPYIYLKMYSRTRAQTTFSIYYNTGDGEQVIEKPGRTQSINRLYLIYEQVNNLSARISVGVVYSSSNLGVTSREVTIYSMGEIAVDYYACAEKVIPFFANNTTMGSIATMYRALGLGVYPGMLITDYFSKVI